MSLAIRLSARHGGVKCISGLIYKETRGVLQVRHFSGQVAISPASPIRRDNSLLKCRA